MSLENLQNLPPEVKEVVFGDELTTYNLQISDQFSLNQNQLGFILDLEERIFLQEISSLDLPSELENMERAEYYNLRDIALELAYKILWPLQDYLKDVDRLILRLGGKVPRLKHLQRHVVQNPTLPDYLTGNIKQMLKHYPDFKDLRLSSKKIVGKEGNLLSPTVANWIEDYVKEMGAGYHSSLQRAKYLAKALNILSLSDEERASIRNFLVSYDEDQPVSIDNSDVIIRIKEHQEKEEESSNKPLELKQILEQLEEQIAIWRKKVVGEDLIMSEAEGSLHKLREVLWQALGIQDQDKVIGCLQVLLQKRALDLMLQEDKRIQSIIKRFISVRYGDKLSNSQIQGKLLLRRIFFELVLSDKLRLSQGEATLVAFYLSNLQPNSGQIVYLDLTDNKLKWRELNAVNNQLNWAN